MMKVRLAQQSGLTIIELMIGSLLGLILSLTIMTTVINGNEVNRESMKAIELTENGRFLNDILKDDIANAGFYGAYAESLNSLGIKVAPDPCDKSLFVDSLLYPIQVFDNTSTLQLASLTSCDLRVVPNTDVVVIRRASSVPLDPANLPDEYNMQSEWDQINLIKSNDPTAFTYTNKAETEEIRQFLIHIYYVSPCRETDCGSADATDSPTLKRLELFEGEFTSVVIAEGVEQLQFEFGIDRFPSTERDGIPDESVEGADDAYVTNPTDEELRDLVAVRLYALVRSNDKSDDRVDNNLYDMGLFGFLNGSTLGEKYKRRVFLNLTRVNNIAIKRES